MNNTKKSKIAFIPIDNRPVCYTLPDFIAKIDKNLELCLPPREYLGDLKKNAKTNSILNWLNKTENIDSIVVALDTIAYGGLIPSRRSSNSFEEIKSNIDKFLEIAQKKNAKIYAFSSIMRISNNNINEEEKEYWNLYGKKIFEYSFNSHKNAPNSVENTEIPEEILNDYLLTRKRNFDINKYYLEIAAAKDKKLFETFVFAKDDCAQFGFNVAEAQSLEEIILKNGINAFIKTGADEIPLTLLTKAVLSGQKVKIAPKFANPESVDKISKYEDISVANSVKSQIETAGAEVCDEENADIILFVNNFSEEQGELVMEVEVEGNKKPLSLPQKPYIIADIVNANGADNCFVKNLLKTKPDFKNFLGYAAWNTTGNTLGSALCCGIIKFLSKSNDEAAFKKVQAIRFLDDWAYQANVRKKLKSYLEYISVLDLKNEMINYETAVKNYLGLEFSDIDYSYPWNRFFEIEVDIKS